MKLIKSAYCSPLRRSLFSLLLVSGSLWAQQGQDNIDYEKALNEFNKNDFEAAYIHLKNSLKATPDYLPSKILMGKVLMISGYLPEAETELEEALNQGADPNLVVDALGKTWLYLEKYQQILNTSFQNLQPEACIDWMVIVATANLNLGNIDKAREIYQRAISESPRSARLLNAMASLELNQGNPQLANNYLKKALGLEDNNANSWRLLGDYHLRNGDRQAAVSAYENGYEIDDRNPILLRSLVAAYIQNQQTQRASSLLEDVLAQTPGDPTASLLKAWLLASSGQPQEASEILESLSSQLTDLSEQDRANNPELLYIRALAAFALNNYEQASNYFSDYLTAVPDNVSAAKMYARTLIALGQKKQALDVLARHERELQDDLDGSTMLGELYLSNNRTFKTLEIINRLKAQYPDNRDIELLEIKTLIARNKLSDAIGRLDGSRHITSDLSFVLTKSMLLLRTGQFEQANDVADQLLSLAPDNVDFLNFKAAVLIRMKRYPQAQQYIEQVLSTDPQHYSARFNRATILSAAGQFAAANEILKTLHKEQPGNLDTRILLASSFAELGVTDQAVQHLKTVLAQDTDNRRAHEILANLYARQNALDKALKHVNNLLKIAPESPKYLLQRAELFLAQQNTTRALNELQRIGELVKDDPLGQYEMARLQLKANQVDAARASILRATELQPQNLFLAAEFVRIHLQTGALDEAQKHLEVLSGTAQGKAPQVLVLKGDLLVAQNRLQQASEQYFTALQSAPDYRLALAKAYQLTLQGVGIDRFTQQVADLVAQNPGNHLQRNLLADHYMHQNQLDLAEQHYRILKEVEGLPSRAAVLNNLANIYLEKDLAQASQFVDQALEIGPVSAALLDTQGWIVALSGQYDRALTILRRAFAMDAKNPSIRYHLGYTLAKMGRYDEAREELTQALASEQGFAERTRAETLLNTI